MIFAKHFEFSRSLQSLYKNRHYKRKYILLFLYDRTKQNGVHKLSHISIYPSIFPFWGTGEEAFWIFLFRDIVKLPWLQGRILKPPDTDSRNFMFNKFLISFFYFLGQSYLLVDICSRFINRRTEPLTKIQYRSISAILNISLCSTIKTIKTTKLEKFNKPSPPYSVWFCVLCCLTW